MFVLCYVQLLGTDSTDSDDTAPHRPIIAAACRDVINGHLPLSRQRSPEPRDGDGRWTAVKVEQVDCDDVSTDGRVESARAADTDLSQCSPSSHDCQMNPLDLTKRRVSDTEVPGTNTSSSDADAGLTTSHVATQILLLKGERYEILPVGGGRWMSRSEYELISVLKSTDDQPLNTTDHYDDDDDDDDDDCSVGSLDKLHNSTPAANTPDDDVETSTPLDDVSTNTRDVTSERRAHCV